MAAFVRPGEKRQGAFGVTFDLDAGASQAVPIFNKNERLALQEQRRRLPAFQHRCLPAVFNISLQKNISAKPVWCTQHAEHQGPPRHSMRARSCYDNNMLRMQARDPVPCGTPCHNNHCG